MSLTGGPTSKAGLSHSPTVRKTTVCLAYTNASFYIISLGFTKGKYLYLIILLEGHVIDRNHTHSREKCSHDIRFFLFMIRGQDETLHT